MLQRCLYSSVRATRLAGADARPFQTLRSSTTIRTLPARSFTTSRWYGAEEPAKKEDTPQADKEPEIAKEDPTVKELEAKKKEVVEVTDKWKRSIAEYRNLQEQTKREVQAAKDFALQRFAKDLIDSVDNFDRALSTTPAEALAEGGDKDLKALHDGLRMTESILLQTLKKHGLERFDPSEQGDKFDPNRHEATFQVPQPDKQDGTCFHTQQKGFVLNGRVLRAAKVGVVKNA